VPIFGASKEEKEYLKKEEKILDFGWSKC